MRQALYLSTTLGLLVCVNVPPARAQDGWGDSALADSNEHRVPRGSAGQTNGSGSSLLQPVASLGLPWGPCYATLPTVRTAYSPSCYARTDNPFIREWFYGSRPTNYGELYGTGYGPNFFGNFGNAYGVGESRNYFGNWGIGYGLGESRKY